MPEKLTDAEHLKRMKFTCDWMFSGGHFDSVLAGSITPLSARQHPTDPNIAFATFSCIVTPILCNAGGNLHGGAVALIFDLCTSLAVMPVSREGFWDTGHFSRTLNCTYLRPAPQGTELIVECEIVHLGKNMGELRGSMRRKDNGKLCYVCEHGKAKVKFPSMATLAEEERIRKETVAKL